MMVLNPVACKIKKYLQIIVSSANFFVFYKTYISLILVFGGSRNNFLHLLPFYIKITTYTT